MPSGGGRRPKYSTVHQLSDDDGGGGAGAGAGAGRPLDMLSGGGASGAAALRAPAADAALLAAAAERALARRVLPPLWGLALLCYLDRSAVAFAAPDMNADLRLTDQLYGLGSTLFFVGYLLFQVPANLLLLRVGAPRWLGLLCCGWGCAAAAAGDANPPSQWIASPRRCPWCNPWCNRLSHNVPPPPGLASSPEGFLTARLALGCAEAGAFPAIWYYLRTFYAAGPAEAAGGSGRFGEVS